MFINTVTAYTHASHSLGAHTEALQGTTTVATRKAAAVGKRTATIFYAEGGVYHT